MRNTYLDPEVKEGLLEVNDFIRKWTFTMKTKETAKEESENQESETINYDDYSEWFDE